ncbi:unnamed protein product [Calypogeia fissa]
MAVRYVADCGVYPSPFAGGRLAQSLKEAGSTTVGDRGRIESMRDCVIVVRGRLLARVLQTRRRALHTRRCVNAWAERENALNGSNGALIEWLQHVH